MVSVTVIEVLPQVPQTRDVSRQGLVCTLAHPVVIDHVLNISNGLIQLVLVKTPAFMKSISEFPQMPDRHIEALSLMAVVAPL